MTRKELLVLVLGEAEGERLSPARVQKSVFLIQENCRSSIEGAPYEFVPHNYGPLCKGIYNDLECADFADLVRIHYKTGRTWAEYSATAKCIEKARELLVSDEVRGYSREVVRWVRCVPLPDLIKSICRLFPDYNANNVYRG